MARQITETEVSERKSVSARDYYTTVVERQDWADVPENGIYAGRSYKIVTRYISNSPDYRGQCIGSSSSPWED